MSETLHCWTCGGALETVPLPIGRRDECPACGADLHVCRQCAFYDPAAHNACREPMADEVTDKERANFCDYFRATARPGGGAAGDEAAAARARLEAMFGGGKPEAGGQTPGDAPGDEPRSEADAAREKLERMFGNED